VALEYFESNPSSLLTDEKGAILLPVITERRIHVGFHNSHVFMGTPVLTNIIPQLDETGHGTELSFQGQVELPKYIAREQGMSLVFVIEYKVKITARAKPEKKKGFFQSQSKVPLEKTYIEKLVCLGWSSWNVCTNFAGILKIFMLDNLQRIEVNHRPTPNPFSVPMYAPTIEVVPGQSELLTPHRMTFRERHELCISFRFNDEHFPPSTPRGNLIFINASDSYVATSTRAC
jgi:hypothetical protein